MPRFPHAARLRRLRARRRELTAEQTFQIVVGDGDPLGVARLVHRAWCEQAVLVPVPLLHVRTCRAIARAVQDGPRVDQVARWLRVVLMDVSAELRTEDPITWRAVPTEPTAFERRVASCFGLRDGWGAPFVRAFHRLPDDERRAVHALVPRASFGLPPDAAPGARVDPRLALAASRRLLAAVRLEVNAR